MKEDQFKQSTCIADVAEKIKASAGEAAMVNEPGPSSNAAVISANERSRAFVWIWAILLTQAAALIVWLLFSNSP